MKIAFGKHIKSLLKEHECVVLPGIGALILKEKTAHISGGQIFPASKTIEFNKNIQTYDNLISSEIIKKENLSFLSAKLEIDKFISELKFDLAQKAFFDLDSLGRFKQTNGSISFIANSQIENLDKSNFGLSSLSVYAVQREIISDRKVKEPVLKEIKTEIRPNAVQKTRSIRKSSLAGLAATFLLMIAIGSLIMTDTSFETLKVQNANVLNFLVPSSSEVHTKSTTLKRIDSKVKTIDARTMARFENQQETKELKEKKSETIQASNELNNYTENLKNEYVISEVRNETKTAALETESVYIDVLSMITDNPKGFYVITGAYSSLANANKAQYECSIENSCKIFKTDSGMYRVGIYTTTEKEIAIDIIQEYKKTNSSYWLMENK